MSERKWPRPEMATGWGRRASHADRLRIRQRYEAGETLVEIGRGEGMSHSTVARVLRDVGVERRPAVRRPEARPGDAQRRREAPPKSPFDLDRVDPYDSTKGGVTDA